MGRMMARDVLTQCALQRSVCFSVGWLREVVVVVVVVVDEEVPAPERMMSLDSLFDRRGMTKGIFLLFSFLFGSFG